MLEGRPDALAGYALAPLRITSPEAVALSGAEVHTIARRTDDPDDVIEGLVFSLTPAEIQAADAYETDAYGRAEVDLVSGQRAFVYVGPDAEE